MGKKRAILITGAAGGLGQTAALALAGKGYQLILLDRRLQGLERVYDQIIEQGGPEPILHPFDLAGATVEHYQELAEHIEQRLGMLHGLIHSAAVFTAFTPLASHDLADWNQIFNVNLHAPYLLTRVLLELLAKSGSGSVLFTSDQQARNQQAYAGAFGVALSGLESLVGIWIKELDSDPRIRMNILLPGPVNTPLRRKGYPGEQPENRRPAADLGRLYVYLMGAESRDVNGQIIDAQTFQPNESSCLNEKP